MSPNQLFGLITAELSPQARTAVWRVFITAIVMGHLTWACGYIPGVSGFAMADEIDEVKEDVKSIQLTLLEDAIFEQRMRHCQSAPQGRAFHLERLQVLLRRFRQATGSPYQLPPCDELQ